jgi:hypothetical protein
MLVPNNGDSEKKTMQPNVQHNKKNEEEEDEKRYIDKTL